ncbi:RNA polymerase II transcription initiation/nucleotide excision repair factor TFIIH subunit TFB2 [Encephalitozoon intestinalis ATCC 50506]|uniref:RNA polymerase II transcription factor B subunit 2 n=1 Tax=Encephalitozoon intestinalis (strain ATCC 50506) TaxID=876142 RepID=E0S5D3_ENCIT|nr:RNA polymerase II transcription initiation/nucleotide excision repair factor TFIIH subunit TFB2 [Encephalitozoon intestinalis ATCC 50506]ADM10918.1 RNA polymerase II transcription initiation/nucleotide excision repair factor TFIIH subunit TFB2 [Encephalitozoon intestinalis ATCC 50506]UTX44552.1 RNA polymerase II transcription initiation/nucleotide excision repair factor TFIIH subunit TFB2 [Encephalitozoon intestinalis]
MENEVSQAWPYPIDIIEYFGMLPEHSKKRLYRAPVFAVSFLKIFDEKTTRFIFDLLLKSHSISSLREIKGIKEVLKTLLRIQMIEKKGDNIYLEEDFRRSLMEGFCMLTIEKHYRSAGEETETDEEESNRRFETILRSIVNKESKIREFGVREVLMFGGLLGRDENITNRGFEFLLKTKKEQLWCLVLLSLKYFLKSVEEEVSTLEAIFELSTKNVGTVYRHSSSMDKRLLKYLEVLGILKLYGENLAIRRSFVQLFEASERNRREFIIVETNNKIYAYTNSEYEKSVIHLFCNVSFNLPNLTKGSITEESVNAAFDKGITGRQIIHFLEASSKPGSLPPAIINQIIIWESKRNRIFMAPGYLYSNFLNLSDYQKVLEFCSERNYLIESDIDRRMIVVNPKGHVFVKEFIKTIL